MEDTVFFCSGNISTDISNTQQDRDEGDLVDVMVERRISAHSSTMEIQKEPRRFEYRNNSDPDPVESHAPQLSPKKRRRSRGYSQEKEGLYDRDMTGPREYTVREYNNREYNTNRHYNDGEYTNNGHYFDREYNNNNNDYSDQEYRNAELSERRVQKSTMKTGSQHRRSDVLEDFAGKYNLEGYPDGSEDEDETVPEAGMPTVLHHKSSMTAGTFTKVPEKSDRPQLRANCDPNNFSFRLRDQESVVVMQNTGRCSWRQACCSSVYLGLTAIILTLIVFLLSTSPHHYRGRYKTSFFPGTNIDSPKFSLCLPVPYTKEKIARSGISAQLASFLLYSLSPFNPNPEILENKDLLAELSKQYRVVEGRRSAGLRKLLRSGAPTCSEVVRACQLANKQILRGEDCCNMFLGRFRYRPEGLCLEGSLAEREKSDSFPLSLDVKARLTIIINTALVNSVDLDHRVVPWDTVRSRALLLSVLHKHEDSWSRDPSRDILIWPGHTATLTARPILVNHKGSNPDRTKCKDAPLVEKQAYTQAGCRSNVMQMIAEKSVNCSLLSLPQTPGVNLPVCGPMESLALMYILREQGDMVVEDPDIRSRFERNLRKKCPLECERRFWDVNMISAEVEEKVANLFGTDAQDISIVEFNHDKDHLVESLQYQSGFLVLLDRLGSITGWLSLTIIIILLGRKACRKQQRLRLKRAGNELAI